MISVGGFILDFKKVFDLISKYNIDQDAIFSLVNEAKSLDLEDEDNIRNVIRKGCDIANKKIDKETEDHVVAIIKKEGISSSLFKYL